MSEIIAVAGPPGGGKSTVVQQFVDQGYHRLNRDKIGGGLDKPTCAIYAALRLAHLQGTQRFVLDNTYGTVKQRAVLLEVAQQIGAAVHLHLLETTAEQAQFFAARHGRVPDRKAPP